MPLPEPILAESHFGQDIGNWSKIGNCTLTYSATEGNPGGCLKIVDAPTGDAFYYIAPQRFLGDKRVAARLEYDIKWVSSNSPFDGPPDVRLRRENMVLSYDAGPPPPKNIWFHRSVPLDAPDGWLNETENRPATAADFKFVLGALESLAIRGEFANGSETSYLDNVVMYAITKTPPPPFTPPTP